MLSLLVFAKHGLQETFHDVEVLSAFDTAEILSFYEEQPVWYMFLCVHAHAFMQTHVCVHSWDSSRCDMCRCSLPQFTSLRSHDPPP